MFSYQFTNNARKNLRRFDKIIADRIIREIKDMCFLSHPIQHRGVKKLSGSFNQYRLRVGIHVRIVFDVIKSENLIRVIEISTRENIKY